ncbi:MAG TPA: proline dehydrogenase family protein [Anaerolineales bacterium]|nr:proline dehydrogenase family protein [Anaerolineales bacterium]
MLREFLLSLSHSKTARTFITRFPVARRVSARFVAGETVAEAIRVMRELNGQGMKVTADHLGENVSTVAEAARAADDYICLLDEIARSGVQSHVSLKLTQFGLDLGDDVALANLRRVVDRAKAIGAFVRVDMESTDYTDRTLALVRAAKDIGYDHLGTVIQSYLYRSATDIEALCGDGIRVRLCKGAYKEPPDKAYPEKKDVDANYVTLTEQLLAAARQNPGLYPAIATHDEKMIAAAKKFASSNQVPSSAFEFQMLYGIRRELQESLVKEGYNVRVYVPYGTEWYPYFMRRLAERPANLWFFASNLLRR